MSLPSGNLPYYTEGLNLISQNQQNPKESFNLWAYWTGFTLKTGPNPPSPSLWVGLKSLVAETRTWKVKTFCSWAEILSISSSRPLGQGRGRRRSESIVGNIRKREKVESKEETYLDWSCVWKVWWFFERSSWTWSRQDCSFESSLWPSHGKSTERLGTEKRNGRPRKRNRIGDVGLRSIGFRRL